MKISSVFSPAQRIYWQGKSTRIAVIFLNVVLYEVSVPQAKQTFVLIRNGQKSI